jgi:hypothetical protein
MARTDLIENVWEGRKQNPRPGLSAEDLLDGYMRARGIKTEEGAQKVQDRLRKSPALIQELIDYLNQNAPKCSSESVRQCRTTLNELLRQAQARQRGR